LVWPYGKIYEQSARQFAFRAEAALDRSQFGVTWNAALDTGAPYLGERVNISIVILAARQD
jgi:polyisoprenoid-binding protein YceI